MARPPDLPTTERFQQLPCGTRAKYVAVKCRCPKCRAANCHYVQQRDHLAKAAARELAEETERSRQRWARMRLSLDGMVNPRFPALPAGRRPCPQVWTAPDDTKQTRLYERACAGIDGKPCLYHAHLRKDSSGDVCGRCRARLVWNGLVPAAGVRAHLKKLSRHGVGYKSVAAAADVSRTTLMEILAGRKHQLRAQAARRVLAVDRQAFAGGALVPARPTWVLVRRLLAEGFTKAEIARRLGRRTPALQIRRTFVTARTAANIERLYHLVMVA